MPNPTPMRSGARSFWRDYFRPPLAVTNPQSPDALRLSALSSQAVEKSSRALAAEIAALVERVRLYAKPITPLKEQEVLEILPSGKRGVWRTIGGRAIPIEVEKGETIPEAVQRVASGPSKTAGLGPGPVMDVPAGAVRARFRSFGEFSEGRLTSLLGEQVENQRALSAAIHAHVFLQSVGGEKKSFLEMTPQEIRELAAPASLKAVSPDRYKFFQEAKKSVEQARLQAIDRIALTQWAESQGGKVKTVRLFRASRASRVEDDPQQFGIFSSWTSDKRVAESYARGMKGKVLTADVPIGSLLLSPRSAPRMKDESEYLVLNRGLARRRRRTARLSLARSSRTDKAVAQGSVAARAWAVVMGAFGASAVERVVGAVLLDEGTAGMGGNGKAVTFAKPGLRATGEEVLTIGPGGQRGVWKTVAGNPVFIVVEKGQSVPEAIREAQGKAKGKAATLPIQKSAQRAWAGTSRETQARPSKQAVGTLAEGIATAWLRAQGARDAGSLNVTVNNFPLDLVHDREVIEVKAGLVSNGPGAQKWRATLGEPGNLEKAWLREAGPARKAAWNAKKRAAVLTRKEAAARAVEKVLGRKVKRATVALIVDPDRKVADLYRFEGFHTSIRWKSPEAERAYVGSVKFAAKFALEPLEELEDREIEPAEGVTEVPEDIQAEFDASLAEEARAWVRAALTRFRAAGGNGKAVTFAKPFDPSEHPRDERGRFAEKGEVLYRSPKGLEVRRVQAGRRLDARDLPDGRYKFVYDPQNNSWVFPNRRTATHGEAADQLATPFDALGRGEFWVKAGRVESGYLFDPAETRFPDGPAGEKLRRLAEEAYRRGSRTLRAFLGREAKMSLAKDALDAAVASYRPDYARIEQTLDALQAQLLPRLQRVFRDAKDKIKSLIERRVGGGGLDFRFVEGLELRGLGDLVPLLRAYLHSTFLAGRREAGSELARARARRYVWQEELHPRDERGQWVEKGGVRPEHARLGNVSPSLWGKVREDELPIAKDDEFYAVRTASPAEIRNLLRGQKIGYEGTAYQFWGANDIGTALEGIFPYHEKAKDRNLVILALPKRDPEETGIIDPEYGVELSGYVEKRDIVGILNPRTGKVLRLPSQRLRRFSCFSTHFFRAYAFLAARLKTYREQTAVLPDGQEITFVDGDPGRGPCTNCGWVDETRSGACFGCFMTEDPAPMAGWERKLFSRWLAENPGWPRAAEWWRAKGYAKPIDPLKEGETLVILPSGKRGIWRTIGGRAIPIEVGEGESIPEAVRRSGGKGKKEQRIQFSTTLGKILARQANSGGGPYYALFDDKAGTLLPEYAGRKVSRPEITAARRDVYAATQQNLARLGFPDIVVVYRGGSVQKRGAVPVSLSESAALMFAERTGGSGEKLTRFQIRRKDILADVRGFQTGGAFRREEELVVGAAALGRAEKILVGVGGAVSRKRRAALAELRIRLRTEKSPKKRGDIIFVIKKIEEELGTRYAASPFLTVTDPYGGRARIPLAPGGTPTIVTPSRLGPTLRPPEQVPPAAAINYFEDKAFAWKGILADDLLADIKRVLLGSITTGEPPEETYDALERVFGPYVGDLAALPDQEQTQPYRLETLVRTQTTEAFNVGRQDAFAGSVADGFITGFEFDAVLDTRTTPVCNFLGGRETGRPFVLPPFGEKLDRLRPPRCYNCRSILSPITRIEDPAPEIISDADFARAVELSCEGFSEQAKARAYAEGSHDFSSTQLDLPTVVQDRLRGWVRKNITPEDLSPDEKQDDAFHVTVLYGLHNADGRQVAEAVAGSGPVTFRLGAVEVFDTNPQYDVLILPVLDNSGREYVWDESKHPRDERGRFIETVSGEISLGGGKRVPYVFGHESDEKVSLGNRKGEEDRLAVYNPKTGQLGLSVGSGGHMILLAAVGIKESSDQDNFARVQIKKIAAVPKDRWLVHIVPPYTRNVLEEKRFVAATLRMLDRKELQPKSIEIRVSWLNEINRERFGVKIEDPKKVYAVSLLDSSPDYDVLILPVLDKDGRRYVWDESLHPREPAGTEEGGQFAPAGGGAGDLYGKQSAEDFPKTSEEHALEKTLAETVGIESRLVIQNKLAHIRREKVRESWEVADKRADSRPDRSPAQERWESGLTDRERKAVVSFLSQPYDSSRTSAVQRADAEGDTTSEIGQQAQLIRAAINRAPKIGARVFRGVGRSSVPEVGDEIDQGTFKSWSRSRSIAVGYAIVNARPKKIIYSVEAEVVDVAALGPYSQTQKEVWVDKGKFRVAHVARDPRYEDTWYVDLKKAGRGRRFALARTSLHQLRATLEALPRTKTQAVYRPHVTLAYVKKGAARRFLGAPSPMDTSITVDRLRFTSWRAGVGATWVSLLPGAKPYALPLLEEGETKVIGPEGKPGVWRTVSGRKIFIEAPEGLSVPEAVKKWAATSELVPPGASVRDLLRGASPERRRQIAHQVVRGIPIAPDAVAAFVAGSAIQKVLYHQTDQRDILLADGFSLDTRKATVLEEPEAAPIPVRGVWLKDEPELIAPHLLGRQQVRVAVKIRRILEATDQEDLLNKLDGLQILRKREFETLPEAGVTVEEIRRVFAQMESRTTAGLLRAGYDAVRFTDYGPRGEKLTATVVLNPKRVRPITER